MSAYEYFRTPEMLGTKPFKCLNCGALMIRHFVGTCYELRIECRRCKCEIYVKCKESIPVAVELKPENYELQTNEYSLP